MDLCLFVVGVSLLFGIAYADCTRPSSLKVKEEYCWKEEVELVERIQQTSKSVLNFAKKKLGIEVEEARESQKCSYYQCILNQLKLVNANGFPVYEHFEKWIETEVIYEQAKRLMDQLEKCNNGLSEATVSDSYFDGDLIVRNTSVEVSVDVPSSVEKRSQSQCEIIAEFVKCLSHQENCPVFEYP